jgi:hypothetical protein
MHTAVTTNARLFMANLTLVSVRNQIVADNRRYHTLFRLSGVLFTSMPVWVWQGDIPLRSRGTELSKGIS